MKKIISVILAVAVTAGAAAAAASETAVESLQSQGILQGDENGNLNLDSTVTRAEFCKMLIEAVDVPKTSSTMLVFPFSDIEQSHWAYDYIHTAAERDIIKGFEDGTFRPDDNVTYEQAIKMALVTARIMSGGEIYPTDYISRAIDECLTEGVTASIGEAMTREDAANLIYNVQQYQSEQAAEDSSQESVMYAPSAGGSASSGGSTSSSAASSSSIASDSAPEVTSDGYVNGYINPYYNTEEYTAEEENIFKNAAISPLSTFSIDTDTASYSNMRRFIVNGQVPVTGSIRSEELINYFDYDLPEPENGEPFSITTEVSKCPWNEENQLAMISIKGEEITEREPQNLVLLLDVSGSMYSANKLPLVKKSVELLLNNLDERDTVSIVTYASGVNLALDSANASEKEKIMSVLNALIAGGGTNGSGGLELAYELAEKNKIDGNNRIILCTDGDFNIGPSSTAELEQMVTEKRDKGIFISVLGFGMGNYKDNRMEILADKGNGNYYYIDSLREAKKVFVDEMTKTLYTIAKDVKIQVEFNPSKVSEYRLVGYENRKLNNEDFNDDTKDAGELGAGASVTVFYEIVPADGGNTAASDTELRYQRSEYKESDELFCVNLRYKEPSGTESKLIMKPVSEISDVTSDNFRFAASAAELGMILNNSEYKGAADYSSVIELAKSARGEDEYGIRTEFIQLVDLLRYISVTR